MLSYAIIVIALGLFIEEIFNNIKEYIDMKVLSDNLASATLISESEESAKVRHLAVMKDIKLMKYGIAANLAISGLTFLAVVIMVLL